MSDSAADSVPEEARSSGHEPQLPAPVDDLTTSYELAVEMADRVTARRQTANAFFLSLNTILLTTVGVTDVVQPAAADDRSLRLAVAACIAGVLFSAVWFALLWSYRMLNEAKYQVIRSLEERLTAKIYTMELEIRQGRGWIVRAAQVFVELLIPAAFGVVYFAAAVILSVT